MKKKYICLESGGKVVKSGVAKLGSGSIAFQLFNVQQDAYSL